MSRPIDLEVIYQKLDRIDRKLTALLNRPKQETRVSGKFLAKLTEWTPMQPLRAREYNLVKYRKEDNKIKYFVESLNQMFITNPKYKQINQID